MLPDHTPSDVAVRTRIGAGGRVVIPASLRKKNKWKEGDEVMMSVDALGRITISDPTQAWLELQALVQAHDTLPSSYSLADELIAERREESRREQTEWGA